MWQWKLYFSRHERANWEENGGRCLNWENHKFMSRRENNLQNVTTQKLNCLAQHLQFLFWYLTNTTKQIPHWKTKNHSSSEGIPYRFWKPKFRNLTPPSLRNFVHILKFTLQWLFISSYSLFNTTCFGLTGIIRCKRLQMETAALLSRCCILHSTSNVKWLKNIVTWRLKAAITAKIDVHC
jgi:hypothetical protein